MTNDTQKDAAAINQLQRGERFEKWILFYRSKFHLFSIPLGIVFSIVHLKFAVQYLGQCPVQPMINVYMIVHASVTLLLMLIALIGVIAARCLLRCEKHSDRTFIRYLIVGVGILSVVLTLFILSWLVAGSVWVFGAKSYGVQGSDSTITSTYCQSELYRAAFVLVIVNYVTHFGIIAVLIVKQVWEKMKQKTPPPIIAKNGV